MFAQDAFPYHRPATSQLPQLHPLPLSPKRYSEVRLQDPRLHSIESNFALLPHTPFASSAAVRSFSAVCICTMTPFMLILMLSYDGKRPIFLVRVLATLLGLEVTLMIFELVALWRRGMRAVVMTAIKVRFLMGCLL